MACRIWIAFLLVWASGTKADYGGPVGLVSQAGSSSGSSGAPYAAQARYSSNTNNANSNAYATGDQTDTRSDAYTSDDSNDYSGGASNAASSASSSSSSGGRFVPAGAGPGNNVIAVALPAAGNDNNVRVMNLNTNSDLGSQIQFTIREVLRKFGIQMANNIRASFQPGQVYVYQSNGSPYSGNFDQSQFQSVGGGYQAQSQSGSGMSQYQSQQPVAVSYKYIGQPNQAVAFRVGNYGDQGGAAAMSSASAQSHSVPVNNNQAVVSYTGNIQPQVTVYRNNNNDYGSGGNNAAAYADSSGDAQSGAANYGSGSYAAPPPSPPRRQSVKYAASSNKKSVESSNVAYESTSE